MEQLEELFGQLCSLGYHPQQIRRIVRDAAGTADFDVLSLEQRGQLVIVFSEYIEFASKCKSILKSGSRSGAKPGGPALERSAGPVL